MNSPKLRFSNNGRAFPEWTSHKLKDCVSFSKGGSLSKGDLDPNGDTPCLLYGEIYTLYGSVAQTIFSRTDSAQNLIMSKSGDVVFPASSVVADNIASATCVMQHNVAYGSDIIVLRGKTIHGPFLSYALNSPHYRTQILNRAQGTAVTHLRASSISEISVHLPCIEEQKLISDFFSTLDEKIELIDKKIQLTSLLCKAMNESLFSQKIEFKDNGLSFPEWETISFADAFEFISSKAISRNQLNYESGIVKSIHYGDILTKFNSVLESNSEALPFINEDVDVSKIASLQSGDIVLADTAEDLMVGKATEVAVSPNDIVTAGLHTMACRPKLAFYPGFLGYYMNSNQFHSQLKRLVTGTKVLAINKSQIVKTKIQVPSIAEQKMITQVLSELDRRLDLIKRYKVLLERQKRGFMQQMFV